MQKEAVQELLTGKLIDIVDFNQENEILYGRYAFNQLTVGNYFIDYSNKALDIDLREYQEKFIANQYYKVPGHLQWNYYLIFLRDQYQEEEKLRIEKDDIFTRKYVFNPAELKEYFNYQKSESSVDTDVISTWKEKLKAVDLDEAYSETPYTQAIPRFLSKEVIKDIQQDQLTTEQEQTLTITKISHLSLKPSFRKFPLTREFQLGQVNLLKGVNGSGKTSFLESIELIVTGKNNREPSFAETNGCIEAKYNNENEVSDSYSPGNNIKYRERDISWYSSAYNTGNDLYVAFNRYNFYDSDAAYNLSYKSDVNTLSKFLSSIALGPEFNRIQSRLKGFLERLSKEHSSRKRVIGDETDRAKNAKATLEAIKTGSDPQTIFESFISYATEIKWKKELTKQFEDSFADYESQYQAVSSLINSLNKLLITIKLRNSTALKAELKKLEEALVASKKTKDSIGQIKDSSKSKISQLNRNNDDLKLLEPANKYFAEEKSFSLLNLSKQIIQLSAEINIISRVSELEAQISDKTIFQNNKLFKAFKAELIESHENLFNKQQQLKLQITYLKLNLDKLQGVVSEIKTSGKQYLSLKADADSCPLCETKYPYAELSDRISTIANDIRENVALDELGKQLIIIDSDISKCKAVIKDIELIESAISQIQIEKNYADLILKDIGNLINSTKDSLRLKKSENSKLLLLQQELLDKGLNEAEFKEIKESIETSFENLRLTYSYKDIYLETINRIKKSSSELDVEIRKAQEKVQELESSAKKIIADVAPSINYLDFENEFNYRIDLLKKGISYFDQINEYIESSASDDIGDIDLKLNKLNRISEELKKAKSNQKELTLANQIITEADKKIKLLKPECERIEKGLTVINDILENHNEASVLGNFIESNEAEIQEIFQNIHTPHEFSRIIFNVEQNTVLLKRRIDETEVPMSKISTGQRSALALSIFIALHKKLKHGPNILLFDDPVTYTDDLNILSFLDYLRELVINENRQLFFATANQKLASLFEKKFAFLEGEFKVFAFDRQFEKES